MTLYELIKKYSDGKGIDTMWKSVEIISDYIDEHKDEDPEMYEKLLRKVYSAMCGKHYNSEFGREQIEGMYYTDNSGVKHIAPYWTDEEMKDVYQTVRNLLPSEVTDWDFFVALNMIKSDYGNLLDSWFPSGNADQRVVEMTVSYFNDPDAPHSNHKIWCYFNK